MRNSFWMIVTATILCCATTLAHSQTTAQIEYQAQACGAQIQDATNVDAFERCRTPLEAYLQAHGKTKGEAVDYAAWVVTKGLTSRFGLPPTPYKRDDASI